LLVLAYFVIGIQFHQLSAFMIFICVFRYMVWKKY